MEVGIRTLKVVGVPVHHHAHVHQALDPLASQGDLLIPGQLHRDGDVELSGDLRVLALFAQLDAGPELGAIGHPLRGMLGEADFGMVDAALVGEVKDLVQPWIMQGDTGTVRSRSDGRTAVTAGDDLG